MFMVSGENSTVADLKVITGGAVIFGAIKLITFCQENHQLSKANIFKTPNSSLQWKKSEHITTISSDPTFMFLDVKQSGKSYLIIKCLVVQGFQN